MAIIDKPYVKADFFPFLGLLPFFKKKDTVIGIIGQTHGVIIATKPPKKPIQKINQREPSSADSVVAPSFKLSSASICGVHQFVSLSCFKSSIGKITEV